MRAALQKVLQGKEAIAGGKRQEHKDPNACSKS